jgi:3-hydroxyisobutyrate dehydrogenase-like beta-hydroxyacid dehydrogenase
MTAITGFIGIGHMGGAMARRLRQADFALMVHDLDPGASEALLALGATVGESARALADQCETIFLCLPSIDASSAVAAELARGRALRCVIETSTVGPASVRALAALMHERGVDVVDAPVSGGPSGALAGTLSLMHAGKPGAVARVMPLLQAISSRRFDVGAEPGLAQVCKLVNNAIAAAGMVAACEATVLGVKAGLDAGTLLAAINAGSGRNAATLDKFPGSILTGSFDFGGPLGLMLKDLQLFIEQARAYGVASSMAPAALAAWEEGVQRSGPMADYTALIRHMETDAGVAVRSP